MCEKECSKIDIRTSEEKNAEVIFKGENEITSLFGFNDLKLYGESTDDVLVATEEISSPEKLEITSGIIKTGFLSASEGMVITGAPQISLDTAYGGEFAELDVMKSLVIDFDEGGFLHIADTLQTDMPAYIEKLELGKNTEITIPEKGYLKLDPKHSQGLNMSIIFEATGKRAEEVMFSYVE